MGNKGGGSNRLPYPEQRATQTSDRLAELAERGFWQTEPMRYAVGGDLMSALQKGDVTRSIPMLRPARETLNAQFGQAREDVLRGGARGGMLRTALKDVDVGRANAMVGLEAGARQDLFGKALATAFGQPGVSFAGMGSAANQQAQVYGTQGSIWGANRAAQAQESQAKGQGMGSVAALGMMAMKCWVAAALYGLGSRRYWEVRYCLFVRLKGWRGWLLRGAYRALGPWIVDAGLAWMLRPAFDRVRL